MKGLGSLGCAVGVLVVSVILSGCGKSASSDPKGSFESLAKHFMEKVRPYYTVKKDFYGDGRFREYELRDKQVVDLRKTNSLVTPYIGTITSVLYTRDVGPDGKMITGRYNLDDIVFMFGLKDDKWVLTEVQGKVRTPEARNYEESLKPRDPPPTPTMEKLSGIVEELQK